MRVMKSLFAAALVVISPIALAAQESVESTIAAHPAMWVVHTKSSTAYLLGSIHVLPSNVDWHSPELDAAIASADTLVFEAPIDDSGVAAGQEFIRAHGTLPAGQSLPALLDAKTLADYQKAVALTRLPPDTLDHLRPWLASVVLEVAFIQQQHYSVESGVDRQVFAAAKTAGKTFRYFETVQQQLALLMPDKPKLELEEFDAQLKELQTEADELGPLVDAWSHGDVGEVGRLVNSDLDSDPGAKKALLDDRNKAWVVQLRRMLAESHTYFITVGAGHLVGPGGVPSLLRKAGYTVDGP
ncbi:MAG: TraB/GumN family protein [Rhizomicrobium sp.]|jgi:uncharacterized protein YbaP (TraB family)